MIVLTYLARAFASLLMDVAGIVVVPVALFQAGNSRLPEWARWFDNDREPFGDLARGPAIAAATGLKKQWLRYVWLGWRNPANNFGRMVGLKQTADVNYQAWGNPDTSDQGEPGCKFVLARCAMCGTVLAFEFYAVWAWHKDRCLRVRLGWKIDQNTRVHNGVPLPKITDGSIAPIVHVINPLMTYTGKGAHPT